MTEIASAFARRSFQPLFNADSSENGIRGWIETGQYYFNTQPTPGTIELILNSLTQFAEFQLYDYARFALSSLETLAHCRSDADHPRAIGWPLLKAYYSGFFGAHALIRATGQGVVRLEFAQTRILSVFGQIHDDAFSVQPGTYHYRLQQNADRTISILFARLTENGGAHEMFWRQFNRFITEIIDEVAVNNEPDATIVVGRLNDLQSILTRAGSSPGSWLSSVRNQLNYQHLLGVWFPYSVSQRDVALVGRNGYQAVSTSRLDYDCDSDTIHAFCAGSLFIAALNFELANLLVGVGTGQRTRFAQNWQRLTRDSGM